MLLTGRNWLKRMAKENPEHELVSASNTEKKKVAPYLEIFLKTFPEKDVIHWNDTSEDEEKLISAIRTPNMYQLKAMILGGAPYNYESVKGESYRYGINQVAFYNRADIMEIIIVRHKHEKVNDKFYKHMLGSALKIVCEANFSDIARMLLDAGTPIYQSHINLAAKYGSWHILEEIIKKIPSINLNSENECDSPLHPAILKNHKHTTRYLLNHKVDPNVSTSDGRNAVHLASNNGNEEILQLLIEYGADFTARDDKGKTAALIAAEGGKDGCIAILARQGVNLDQRDNYGEVPMTKAASLGHASTVKELIKNGASFGRNFLRFNALEMACLNGKDDVAAVIIQLDPRKDFMGYYRDCIWITWMKLVRDRMTESITAMLDRMVFPSNDGTSLGVVKTQYLYLNTDKKLPDEDEYVKKDAYFLQRIARLGDEEIASHGTIRILVDRKMEQIGKKVLFLNIASYATFLLALSYSLIQASYVPIPRNAHMGFFDGFRIFTELFVIGYFIFNCITEAMEFIRDMILARRDIEADKKEKKRENELMESIEKEPRENKWEEVKFDNVNKESPILFVRLIRNYFSEQSNYLDVIGLLTLFILFILRSASQPVQWIFATIAFFANALRIFKYIVLVRYIGPYSTIIYKILIKDVPLFSTLFGLTLLIFTGGYFISLRTPYISAGFANNSLRQDTVRTLGVDNEVQWVFLSGLRVLLEGNVYSDEYLYRHINWLAACIYLSFLFLTVVVFLNVFIAQLSDTYGEIKRNSERTYAWHRLNFIIQIEKNPLFSYYLRKIKKVEYIEDQKLSKNTLLKYYGVTTLKKLIRDN